MGGECAWEGEGGGTGPLGVDYVRAYHCGFQEHGWLFYPVLLGWGCFITYLSACRRSISGGLRLVRWWPGLPGPLPGLTYFLPPVFAQTPLAVGHTADAYFSPTLATLSDKVRHALVRRQSTHPIDPSILS